MPRQTERKRFSYRGSKRRAPAPRTPLAKCCACERYRHLLATGYCAECAPFWPEDNPALSSSAPEL